MLKGEFGEGEWDVEVEGKNSDLEQRVVVRGAKSGDGTYAGSVGQKVSVKEDAGSKWKLEVQHKDGSTGWKTSTIHNVKEGTDDHLIRAEDGTDRDMNDLTVRVKK